MPKTLDIAVAGAGPGGLAAALYLHRAGHRVSLFERFERPRPIGSGLMLQPTGLAVLHQLGLFDEIAALGARIDRLRGMDARSGRVVLDVGFRPLGRGVHALGVHRSALFDVLHGAVMAAGVPLRTSFPVGSLERDKSKGWLRGPKGLEGPFDLVVDAMGPSSPLLGEARPAVRPKALEFGAIWGTVPWVDRGFDRTALIQRYRHASVMIGVLPVGRQRRDGPELAAFFWSLKPRDYEAVKFGGFEAWRETVKALWPATEPHLAALPSFEAMSLARYQHHTLKVPTGEALAFIGDSAHATSPQLGQGANMALLDAAALCAALRDTGSVAEALERYAQLRRWHVRLYQALSLSLTPLYQSDSRALPVLRDLGVAIATRLPPLQRLLAQMVTGQLLNPLRQIGLSAAPSLEVRR